MNQEDRDFINSIADERIQYHYSEHLREIQPDKDQFIALEERLQEALKPLGKEAHETVQVYLEYLFHKSAITELTLYKAGVVDGCKLAKLIQNLE